MVEEKTRPAVYCGTYGKYNDGSIKGKWLYLDDYETAEDFWTACKELHNDESDPEFMFQDFEGFPRELYSESMSDADLAPILAWSKLEDDERELVEEYLDAYGGTFDPDEVEDIKDKHMCNLQDLSSEYGGYMSDEEVFGHYWEDNGLIEIPEHLQGYIDYEAMGREFLQGMSVSSNGFVFWD